jgi:glycosyltransferase involved in cell wall biosynthesis
VKRGHEVDVYTSNMLDLHSNNSLCPGYSLINGVNVYYSKSVWHSKTLIVTPGVISLLSKKIGHYDVIHVHDCRSFQGISTYFFARLKNVPYVFQAHGSYLSSFPDCSIKTVARVSLDNLVSNKIVANASKVIALNKTEAQLYVQKRIPERKIVIIPNGIDLSRYLDLPEKGSFLKKLNIQKNTKVLLYIGRIHKTKRIDVLINAYHYMLKTLHLKNIILVIAGPDDGYLSEIKSLARFLGIYDSILFAGFIDNNDKQSALMDANLFVTPSFQGFPMTFLEACVIGTPIVTTTLGDNLEWINNNVGYVTSPKYDDLAKAMSTLLSNVETSDLFSRNCRNFATSVFSIEKTVDKLEKIYEEVAYARKDS